VGKVTGVGSLTYLVKSTPPPPNYLHAIRKDGKKTKRKVAMEIKKR
jgi:hypothetical protein